MNRQHVVLIDDSELNLRTQVALLERLDNVQLHCFTSSTEALAWSVVNSVDCFVVDFHMPHPDGVEVARILRRNPKTWHTPIIMVTGEHERKVRYAALDAGVSDFVEKPVDPREFVSRVSTFLELDAARKRLDSHVGDLTESLRSEEERSRQHAVRLEVLWKVATNPLFDGEEMLVQVLTQSAAAIRPGEEFIARLFRIDGDTVILEAACETPFASNLGMLPVGTRVPLAGTNIAIARDRGTAIAWDDVQKETSLPGYDRLRELGIRSQLIVPLRAAGVDYVLAYSSHRRTERTFGADDLTFVAIVAAFLQALYQQRWQSDRIQHHMQFDALTGLMNRTRFRALMREALAAPAGCAVAIADVIGFSEINRRFGNLLGDALLVEVAAGLSAMAHDGDFVGRLGGDAFGICLPGASDEGDLRRRLEPYLRVFDRPFSTGDRKGEEFVALGARIGAALARPGLSYNDVLAQADLAIKATHENTRSHITVYDGAAHGVVAHIG